MRIAFIGGGHMSDQPDRRTALRRPAGWRHHGRRSRGGPARAVAAANSACTARTTTWPRPAAPTWSCSPSSRRTWRRPLAAWRPRRGDGRRVVLSIAAGIRLANLATWLGGHVPLVRAMPNRPALIGAGITAACAGAGRQRDRARACRVGACGGRAGRVARRRVADGRGHGSLRQRTRVLLPADRGASRTRATALGLPRETARRLAVQTALGSARMAAEGTDPPERLREQVTSRGGTTAAALAVLESADLRGIFARAIDAAARRSAELADQFGTD